MVEGAATKVLELAKAKAPIVVQQAQPALTSAQQLQLQQQRQRSKPPGVSYRATLQKLSNTISLSSAEIMQRYEKLEPSLTLHFYKSHWKFDNQDGIFMYNSPARQILEVIRNEQIPVDCLEVFRDVKVRYYEGCLIVRLVDNREDPPSIMHTVLRPSPESIWTELLLYSEQTHGNFTDAKAVQVESDMLVATHSPLDLRPVIHPEQSAWLMEEIKDKPLPRIKRKRQALHEDDEEERLMYLYDERHGKEFAPDFKRLAFVEANRKAKLAREQQRIAAQAAEASKTAAANAAAASPHLNGHVQRTSQSPVVPQQAMHSSPQTQSTGTPSHIPSVPAHLQQSRPSASPQLGPRSLSNQQALAQHLAQQNQALQNGGAVPSPRMPNQLPPGVTHGSMVTDLARQQQIMLQQRALAMRKLQAAQNHQAANASPRVNANGQLQIPQLGGPQNTPTPLQMQQIRQLQAQQQQQLLAQHQQAAQNTQYQQMR